MNDLSITVLVLVSAYFFGAIPSGVIIGRLWRGVDIRSYGSGGSGATNVNRTLGPRAGAVVLASDITKGLLVTGVARYLVEADAWLIASAGTVAVLGHMFPVYIQFKGGKGVGTLGGMLLALFLIAVPLCLVVFAIVLVLTGYVSVSSMIASIALPVFLFILPPLGLAETAPFSLLIFSLLIPWFIIFTHRSNIARLRSGEENRFEKAMLFRKNK